MTQFHTVQPGETISQLARQYGVTAVDLQSYNPFIGDPNQPPKAGWRLEIPERRFANQDAMPEPKAQNSTDTGQSKARQCDQEYTEVIHVTGETEQAYLLTPALSRRVSEATSRLANIMAELHQLQKQPNTDDNRKRYLELWQQLKCEGALPRLAPVVTVDEVAAAYDQRKKARLAALEKQRNRKQRFEQELDPIRQKYSILTNRRYGRGGSRKTRFDELYERMLRRIIDDMERELADIDALLNDDTEAYEQAVKESLGFEKKHKLLRAAVEAEVEYRAAKAGGDTEPEILETLETEARQLQEQTRWEQLGWENRVQALADKRREALDLAQIDHHRSQNAHTYERRQRRNQLNEQIEAELNQMIGEAADSNFEASTSFATATSFQLIEIKRTSEPGFRYLTKDVFDGIRTQARTISRDDLKQALTKDAFVDAGKQGAQSVRKSVELQAILGEWRTSEDNFFNHLNRELFSEQVSSEGGVFDASAEAQMMRFAATGHAATGYNPATGEAFARLKGEVSYSLLEGKAEVSTRLPSEQGYPLKLSYLNATGDEVALHCGHIRSDATFKFLGFAGACASLATDAIAQTRPGEAGLRGEVNGEAFAGARLKNEMALSVLWKPAFEEIGMKGRRGEGQEFKSLLDVIPELAVQFGVGAAGSFGVFVLDGSLHLKLRGELAMGPGIGGGVAARLNAHQILGIIDFLRLSLEASDFRFMAWLSEQAFELLSMYQRAVAWSSASIESLINQTEEDIRKLINRVERSENIRNEVVSSARALDSIAARNLTPHAKSALLKKFAAASQCDAISESEKRILTGAGLQILKSIRHHRELLEIMRLEQSRTAIVKKSLIAGLNDLEQLGEVFSSRESLVVYEKLLTDLYS